MDLTFLADSLFDLTMRPTFPGLKGGNWIALPLLGLSILFYAWVYRGASKTLTFRQRASLTALRVAGALLVLVMVLQPSVKVVKHEERLPVVGVLVDGSKSMNYPAARGNALLQANPKSSRSRFHGTMEALDTLQRDLSTTHRVKVFEFSDTLKLAKDIPYREDPESEALAREDLLSSFKHPEGEYTEAGDAILGVMDRLVGHKIAGLILLSDGTVTGGETFEHAGEGAVQAGVPVHALTFGSRDPLRDLRIDRVDAPAEASLGDVLAFNLEITNYIEPDLKIKIKLFENDELDQARSVRLKKGLNRVTLTTVPRTEGLRTYRVVLPEMEDEVDYANNKEEVHVKVVKRTLRLLFIAGKATREYQHVVLCLLRDPIIKVSCFLQSAHVDYVQQGNVVIDRLPTTVKEWQEYDVILLYDPDPKKISTQQVAGLENTVSKGAGLLMVAGRSFGLGQLLQIHANKMRQLLPVEVDKNLPMQHHRYFSKPFKLGRTPEVRYHKVFNLVADERLNEEIWSNFPGLYWCHPIVRVKSGAMTALKRMDRTGSSAGVMAIQRFNEGSSIYIGTDEIWRWRNPFGAHDYDLFWTGLIRYLGESRLLGEQKQVALATNKNIYAPGEKVAIRLKVLDHALMQQLDGEQIYATVVDANKARQQVPLDKDTSGLSLYRGTYAARRVGSHLLQVSHRLSTADTEAKDLFSVQESFKVAFQSLESLDTRANLDGMKKLADKTGGRYLDHVSMSRDALKELAGAVPADKLLVPQESVKEIWNTWLTLLFLLALLGVEWSLRKYWGLL